MRIVLSYHIYHFLYLSFLVVFYHCLTLENISATPANDPQQDCRIF